MRTFFLPSKTVLTLRRPAGHQPGRASRRTHPGHPAEIGSYSNIPFGVSPFRNGSMKACSRSAWPMTAVCEVAGMTARSEEHTSELQSLMRISYAVFCLKKKTQQTKIHI